MKFFTIILTYNEELHIRRCISSALQYSDHVFVVDSYSTDLTVDLCSKQRGVTLLQNKFQSHASQFNWALSQINEEALIFRLDADEIADVELQNSIKRLKEEKVLEDGYVLDRYIEFDNEIIKYGGIFPTELIRVFKSKKGFAVQTLMDEHIIVDGSIGKLDGRLVDKNLNNFSFWQNKHNHYAKLEALKHIFEQKPQVSYFKGQTSLRQNNKNLYYRFPLFLRAILLFLYRYLLRGGFRNGPSGQCFLFFQVLVYRMTVDYYIRKILTILNDDSLENKISAISSKIDVSESTLLLLPTDK